MLLRQFFCVFEKETLFLFPRYTYGLIVCPNCSYSFDGTRKESLMSNLSRFNTASIECLIVLTSE